MKMSKHLLSHVFVCLLAVAVLAVSCKGKVEEKARTRAFPPVSVPSLLSQNEVEARNFTLRHYWDRFADTSQHDLLCDSLHIGGVPRGDVEQAFSNWLYVMMEAGPASYETAVGSFYDRLVLCEEADSSSNIYEGTVDVACRYLYDPNSPMRDEEMYLPLCRRLAESPLQDSLHRAKYAKQAVGCSLNRIGTKAADFAFSDKNGRIRTLYGIKADWTLLFFSNPGCHACKDIIETLKAMPGLDAKIADKKLAVVNVYIDEDMTGWYDYMPYYPDNWYNGYDHNLVIRTDHLYDVRAIPSLYLLDKEKKVVLKDAPENRMYHQLEKLL